MDSAIRSSLIRLLAVSAKESVPRARWCAPAPHGGVFACRRLAITPEELYKEPEANGDLADLESGAVLVKVLRHVAMTLGAIRA